MDGPTRKSFRRLLVSPGELTVQHLDGDLGGGTRHVHPIRLYLTINLLFFLLAPWVNSSNISVWQVQYQAIVELQPALNGMVESAITHSGAEDPKLFQAILNERLSAQQGALVWMLIPVLGLASFAVARRRRGYLVEHFVFATNLVSFFLVSLMAVGLSGRLVAAVVDRDSRWFLLVLVPLFTWMVWVWFAVYRSAKSFHGFKRRGITVLFTIWLGLALQFGFWLYLQALLVVTLFGLRDLSLSVAG
ncbi:MAG: DUF3667 domain-containing protein [Thermoanaerobaculia bacterium]|nr:DUF3667 domain-containing protein [Thermoanaerobaculia bacterium]